jgi:HAD superfamily hydrolase (TIGR01509 family)
MGPDGPRSGSPGWIIDTGDAVTDAVARRAALFDMDGVLVDSEPHHHAAWHRLCLEEGIMLTLAEVAERTLGRPVRESLPTLLGRSIDTREHEQLVRRKAAIYEQVSGGATREVRGAVAFVHSLTDQGVLCGLATSAMPERVGPILDALRLADQFRVQVTGRDVQRGKPDPEVYLTAAARLGVAPGACVVFEDAPVGIIAARRAGMRVVGVATACPAEALRTVGAHAVVSDFARLVWQDVMPAAK